jgi:tyrosyl-tRNA synthetase
MISLQNIFCSALIFQKKNIAEIKKQLESGTNPRDIKMRLAREMVTLYHGQDAAKRAEENFVNTFAKGGVPDDIKEVEVEMNTYLLMFYLKKE